MEKTEERFCTYCHKKRPAEEFYSEKKRGPRGGYGYPYVTCADCRAAKRSRDTLRGSQRATSALLRSEDAALGRRVIDYVAFYYEETPERILEHSREPVLVEMRRVCALLLRESYLGWETIGRILHRDHSTIINLVQATSAWSDQEIISDTLVDLRAQLGMAAPAPPVAQKRPAPAPTIPFWEREGYQRAM